MALQQTSAVSSKAPKIHVTLPKKEKTQAELLANVVVSKRKISNSDNNNQDASEPKQSKSSDTSNSPPTKPKETPGPIKKPLAKPIVAVLPGVGEYYNNSSSSSEYSSDEDEVGCDRVVNANEYAKETNTLFSNHANTSSGGAAQEIGKI